MTKPLSGFLTENLSFSYDPTTRNCINDVNLHLDSGQFYGLIGPNGSGKSTLLDLLSGYISPTSGTIYVNGKNITTFNHKETARLMTSVPQSFKLSFDYSVEEVVLMGRHIHIPRFSLPKKRDYDAASGAIDSMGITHLKNRSVSRLSGGEKQRVMIARALAQETDIILLDEVTSNLDINHSIAIMRTMLKLVHSNGKTVIAALHDLNMASMFCDQLLVLKEGSIVSSGPSGDVISEKLIDDLYHVSSTITADQQGNKHILFSYI